MTLQEFINKYNGVPNVGDTPENTGQCVGLIEVWTDSLGLPHTWGNAKDLLANADTSKFDVIYNTPTGFPLPGDIICWDKTWGGGVGHTGIVVSADANSFSAFEQNNPGAPQINHHNDYQGVIGWLHPKSGIAQTVAVEAATFENMRGKCDRYDLLDAAGYHTIDDVVKKVGGVTNDLQNALKDLQNARNQAASLAGELQKVHSDDSQTAAQLLDAQHQVATLTGQIDQVVKLTSSQSFEEAVGKITDDEKNHKELVKNVQPVIDNLGDAAIYKKTPKPRPSQVQTVINFLRGIFHI